MEEVNKMWEEILEGRKKRNITFYNNQHSEMTPEIKIKFLCSIVKNQKEKIKTYEYLIDSYRELLSQ